MNSQIPEYYTTVLSVYLNFFVFCEFLLFIHYKQGCWLFKKQSFPLFSLKHHVEIFNKMGLLMTEVAENISLLMHVVQKCLSKKW